MSLQAIALLINLALAIAKAWVGTIAGSRALLADALNSSNDVVATALAWAAFRLGKKPPDDNHHYGHANAEALAGLLIGGMICATGVAIAVDSLLSVRAEQPPEAIALWVAGATAVVKFVLWRVSLDAGRRLRSPTLLASAEDHIADVIAGLGAFAGILLARYGLAAADPIAAVAIGGWVFLHGIGPVRANLGILMQEAPPELADRAAELAKDLDGVVDVRLVRAQPIGGHYRMDITIEVAGSLTVSEGHEIANAVEAAILDGEDGVTEVMVHVEPSGGRSTTIPRREPHSARPSDASRAADRPVG